jgi:hypothetical protein
VLHLFLNGNNCTQILKNPVTLQFAEFLSDMIESSNLTADDLSMAYFSLILGSSVNRTLAEMMGLFSVDLIESEEQYLYRVSIQKSTTTSTAIEVNSKVLDKHASNDNCLQAQRAQN